MLEFDLRFKALLIYDRRSSRGRGFVFFFQQNKWNLMELIEAYFAASTMRKKTKEIARMKVLIDYFEIVP